MANLQGYTSGAVGHMLDHYTRHDGDPQQEKYTYNNQKIDKSRTHLNYMLFERRDPRAFIRQRIAEADTKPTKRTNIISDWIITLPKNERLEGREREFFEEAYRFLVEKVGQENVVLAAAHLDESSPHLHFCWVPVCEQQVTVNDKAHPLRWTIKDEAKNPAHKAGEVKRDSKGTIRYKRIVATDDAGNPIVKKTISQSKVFDRNAMKDFHPQLSARMKEHFGFDVGVELEDEGDKVLSSLGHGEYIAARTTLRKTKAEVERIEDKREEIRQRVSEENARLEELQRSRSAASERVEMLEAVATECRAADDAAVSRKGTFFDRIAALCSRFAERVGAAVRTVKDVARQRLVIAVGHGDDEGPGFGGRWASAGSLASPTPMAQPQKEYTL